MKVAVPKEIKNNENRVALTPAGALEFFKHGHEVYIQTQAGASSGFTDEMYKQVGAHIVGSIEEAYAIGELIIKVKEPIEPEYPLIRKGQIIYTYLHLAASHELTQTLLDSGAVCIAYETVALPDGSLPLLVPMSEVAGRMSIQEGAKYLERTYGGKGVLLGGVPGVKPANVLVLGGGVVGTEAAKMAAGLGANVTILDLNLQRLRHLSEILPPNVKTVMSNELAVREYIQYYDLIIGAVLIPGAKAPRLITRDMLGMMQKGTVLVDVAIDQGGCFETSKPTTHDKPTYDVNGIIHYTVANMPGAVPFTSTMALTNATLPYGLQLANKGWQVACQQDMSLANGLNVVEGKLVNQAVANAFGMKCDTAF